MQRLRQVGYAAVALAVPYSLLTAALAAASRSAQFAASVPQAALCGLLLGLAAGGLGGARALAPWGRLARLIPERQRSVVIAVAASGAVLAVAGALLAGAALAANLHESAVLQRGLGAGPVGTVLLLLLQIGYIPNAVSWAMAFAVGPGFAFGAGTIVAPTGSALGQLPAVPLLAALPPGVHATMPGWLAPLVLALPYVAGGTGGWLLIRMAPTLSLEAAPLWGMASGAITGLLVGVLAAFSGGPLGDGRLAGRRGHRAGRWARSRRSSSASRRPSARDCRTSSCCGGPVRPRVPPGRSRPRRRSQARRRSTSSTSIRGPAMSPPARRRCPPGQSSLP